MRRTAVIGVFVAVLALAVCLPSVALAANTAKFSSSAPARGSITANAMPLVGVTVYDLYGVRYSSNYSLSVDGVAVRPSIRYYSGYGYKKFRLSYQVTSAFSAPGWHVVSVRVHDLRHRTSTTSWGFWVVAGGPVVTGDVTAPITNADAVAVYRGPAAIRLSAADNAGGSGVAHTYYRLDGGLPIEGTMAYTNGLGSHTLEYWSVDVAGNVETHKIALFDVVDVHASPVNDCTGCHTADLMTIHSVTKSDCAACHSNPSGPSYVCVDCHYSDPANPLLHPAITTVHTAANSCVVAGCHATDVTAIHAVTVSGCAACHGAGKVPSTDCTTCHVAHSTTAPASHALASSPCFGCHPANAADIHTTWAKAPGCAACHALGKTPSFVCADCHDNIATVHDYVHPSAAGTLSTGCTVSGCHGSTNVVALTPGHTGCSCHTLASSHINGIILNGINGDTAECLTCHTQPMDATAAHPYHVGAHDTLAANIAGTTSAACTACHGTNVLDVSAGSPHIAGEHKGCSCHAYGEATPANTQCTACHQNQYAPHGFVNGVSHTGSGFVAASGHTTSAFGTRGIYTMWDGSEGVVIKDSAENTVTTPIPFPTVDVFWASGDPSAPAGAITGLTSTSVVTCEDCHTGLLSNEIAGPHGGATFVNAGIDPAFPGQFENAYLWGVGASQKINGTTVTIPGNASGVVNYVPGGTTALEKQELANWQLWMPVDDGNPATKNLVSGPATITAGTVICVKCHDLANDGLGLVVAPATAGYGNMPHEHHADRPVVNLGKYDVGNGGGITTVTVVAESAAAAKAMVTGATTTKELVKPSLGREGAGACRDCHIAVPHGWKRPRLIVYSTDSAPYNAGPSVYEGEPVTGTNLGSGQMNGISSQVTKTYSAPDQPTMPPLSAFTETVWNGPVLEAEGYTEWDTTQCNACGHHSSTLFDGSTTTPTHSTRSPYNWSYVTYSNGMWK